MVLRGNKNPPERVVFNYVDLALVWQIPFHEPLEAHEERPEKTAEEREKRVLAAREKPVPLASHKYVSYDAVREDEGPREWGQREWIHTILLRFWDAECPVDFSNRQADDSDTKEYSSRNDE